jgi:hypothetical protein
MIRGRGRWGICDEVRRLKNGKRDRKRLDALACETGVCARGEGGRVNRLGGQRAACCAPCQDSGCKKSKFHARSGGGNHRMEDKRGRERCSMLWNLEWMRRP